MSHHPVEALFDVEPILDQVLDPLALVPQRVHVGHLALDDRFAHFTRPHDSHVPLKGVLEAIIAPTASASMKYLIDKQPLSGVYLMLPRIEDTMRGRSFAGLGERVELAVTTFGRRAGVIGAAALALDTFFYRQGTLP